MKKPHFPEKNAVACRGHAPQLLAAARARFLNNLVLTIDYAAPNLPALFQPPGSEKRLHPYPVEALYKIRQLAARFALHVACS